MRKLLAITLAALALSACAGSPRSTEPMIGGHPASYWKAALMKPYAGAIEAWEVGAEVGNVRNNRPELMERVGLL